MNINYEESEDKSLFFDDIDQMINFIKGFRYTKNWEDQLIMMLENTKKYNINLKYDNMKREEIYKEIDKERDYQDKKWKDGDVPDRDKDIAEWVNYMEFHLHKASNKIYNMDKEGALDEIRKVTALGVCAMEVHGCPSRKNGCSCDRCKCTDNG